MGIIKHFNNQDFEVFIFDDFIINQIKEGVAIEPYHNDILNKIVQKYYSNKDLVYISNRVNSYSVDPLIYAKTESIPNIIAIALVPKTEIMRSNAEYERDFYDRPYKIFDTLTEAIVWVSSLVKTKKKNLN
ncbi:hypothetical protein [Lacinutrix salivirga]